MFAVKTNHPDKANIQERVGDYTISVAFDDSCGALTNLGRSDIRVFDENPNAFGYDVTRKVLGKDFVDGTLENLVDAYQKVKALQCVYFAIGVNAWGKGSTPKQALKVMRENCAKHRRNHYQIFEVWDTGAYVNGINGSIHSKVEPKLVETGLK